MAVAEIPRSELHGEIVYPNEMIVKLAGRLALKVTEDYGKVSDLLVVPLLEGGQMFADLMQEEMSAIGFNPDFFPIKIKTYDENNDPIDPKLVTPLSEDIFVPGRHYLFLDDMLHRGITLAHANEELIRRKLVREKAPHFGHRKQYSDKVRHLANLVMVERLGQKERDITAHYAAFQTRLEDWLVGYGLDDGRLEGLSADCGRSIPYVAKALTKEQVNYLRAERDLPLVA